MGDLHNFLFDECAFHSKFLYMTGIIVRACCACVAARDCLFTLPQWLYALILRHFFLIRFWIDL